MSCIKKCKMFVQANIQQPLQTLFKSVCLLLTHMCLPALQSLRGSHFVQGCRFGLGCKICAATYRVLIQLIQVPGVSNKYFLKKSNIKIVNDRPQQINEHRTRNTCTPSLTIPVLLPVSFRFLVRCILHKASVHAGRNANSALKCMIGSA